MLIFFMIDFIAGPLVSKVGFDTHYLTSEVRFYGLA